MNGLNLTPEQLQQLAVMLRKQGGQPGMMNFDQNQWTQMMSNPAAREAGAEMAGLASEQAAMQMQAMGRPRVVPNGGLKSPLEAASEGLTAGMGMYQMLNAQRAKADAIRNFALAQQKEKPTVEVMEVDMANPVPRPLEKTHNG